MALAVQPIWSRPATPTREDLVSHFSGGEEPFPAEGVIIVRHKWSWWFFNLVMTWLLGALIISPMALIFFRNDALLGTVGRIGATLIGGAFVCFLVWLLIGGWGPPFPVGFAAVALVIGAIWSWRFLQRKRSKR